MTDYTKTTDFTSKDSLPSGDSGKIIRGAEFGTEFDNIQTAVNSKSNINNPAFTGNITVTGTVDGRDIATDGTKLDTIETSADVTDTTNVTAAGAVMDSELTDITAVKALNQGVATTDSPTFAAVTSTGNVTVGGTVDGRDIATDGTKLDTVETSADVTDTTNVTAAGALMDSEVTNLAQVKAFDSSDYATAAQGTTADAALPRTGGAMTGAITTNSTFDGRDVATDGTKLDGIEASADVTDATNVTAAGALMDSELTDITAVKALNQGVATTDAPTFAGLATTADVSFGDNDKAIFGTGSDLQIYHDPANGSYVSDQGVGSLNLLGSTYIRIKDATDSNTAAEFNPTGASAFYYNNAQKLATTSTGIDVTGNATFADNGKAIFGTDSDMSLFHNGNNGFLDNDTGTLFIQTDSFSVKNATGTESLMLGTADGAVTLYHNNLAKLATSSSGIDVTGTIVGDGLTVDGNSTFTTADNTAQVTLISTDTDALVGPQLNLWRNSGVGTNGDLIGQITFTGEDTVGATNTFATIYGVADQTDNGAEDGSIHFQTLINGTLADRLEINSAGNSVFTGNVGIGTSIPATHLHVQGSSGEIRVQDTGSGGGIVSFRDSGTSSIPSIQSSGNNLLVNTGGSERMRIDSSGNLLVGTSTTTAGNEGMVYFNGSSLRVTRDSDEPLNLDRLTTDGTIAAFKKDGTTVGSIGTASSRLYIGTDDTGLRFTNDEITPFNPNVSADRNGTVDLGGSSTRFKDLYLSGGAYLGGTAAANKLDDYEEGTWTPTLEASTTNPTGTVVVNNATYTKVGRMVHVQAYITVNVTNVGAGGAQIAGLPFTVGTGYASVKFSHGSLILSNGGYFNNGSTRIIAITDHSTSSIGYSGTGAGKALMLSGIYEVA